MIDFMPKLLESKPEEVKEFEHALIKLFHGDEAENSQFKESYKQLIQSIYSGDVSTLLYQEDQCAKLVKLRLSINEEIEQRKRLIEQVEQQFKDRDLKLLTIEEKMLQEAVLLYLGVDIPTPSWLDESAAQNIRKLVKQLIEIESSQQTLHQPSPLPDTVKSLLTDPPPRRPLVRPITQNAKLQSTPIQKQIDSPLSYKHVLMNDTKYSPPPKSNNPFAEENYRARSHSSERGATTAPRLLRRSSSCSDTERRKVGEPLKICLDRTTHNLFTSLPPTPSSSNPLAPAPHLPGNPYKTVQPSFTPPPPEGSPPPGGRQDLGLVGSCTVEEIDENGSDSGEESDCESEIDVISILNHQISNTPDGFHRDLLTTVLQNWTKSIEMMKSSEESMQVQIQRFQNEVIEAQNQTNSNYGVKLSAEELRKQTDEIYFQCNEIEKRLQARAEKNDKSSEIANLQDTIQRLKEQIQNFKAPPSSRAKSPSREVTRLKSELQQIEEDFSNKIRSAEEEVTLLKSKLQDKTSIQRKITDLKALLCTRQEEHKSLQEKLHTQQCNHKANLTRLENHHALQQSQTQRINLTANRLPQHPSEFYIEVPTSPDDINHTDSPTSIKKQSELGLQRLQSLLENLNNERRALLTKQAEERTRLDMMKDRLRQRTAHTEKMLAMQKDSVKSQTTADEKNQKQQLRKSNEQLFKIKQRAATAEYFLKQSQQIYTDEKISQRERHAKEIKDARSKHKSEIDQMRGNFAVIAKEMLVKIDAVKETMLDATTTMQKNAKKIEAVMQAEERAAGAARKAKSAQIDLQNARLQLKSLAASAQEAIKATGEVVPLALQQDLDECLQQ